MLVLILIVQIGGNFGILPGTGNRIKASFLRLTIGFLCLRAFNSWVQLFEKKLPKRRGKKLIPVVDYIKESSLNKVQQSYGLEIEKAG